MGRNWQRREEIGKNGGKVYKFLFSSPLRPFSCSLCSLERGTWNTKKIKMTRGQFCHVEKGKKKRVQGKEKGEVFTLPTFIVSKNLTNTNLGTFHFYDFV